MNKQYFKIAWRNLWKHKTFSLINIFGLAAGICFTITVAAYCWQQLSVNSQLKNTGNQYIIQSDWKDKNLGFYLATFGELPREMKRQYPDLVKNYFRFDAFTSNVSENNTVFRDNILAGDSNMIAMYGFKLLQGNPATALKEPFSVVITEKEAVKYFGRKDVLGEMLTIESFSGSRKAFRITGVMKTPPANSVTFLNRDNDNQIIIPENTLSYFGRNINSWQNMYVVGYLELQDGVSPKRVELLMKNLIGANADPSLAVQVRPYLVKLTDYHINKDNASIKKMLYTLAFIAIFILAMAVINFINLSVSKASERMREIGVRKVLGGSKGELITQFLSESVLIVLIASTIAIGLYAMLRPFFNEMLNTELPAVGAYSIVQFIYLGIFSVVLGMIAGIYPAFILSSLQSVDSLKGKLGSLKQNVFLRKTLVVMQFSTAAVVLICALLVSAQVNYFFKKDLGYDKDFIITAQIPRNWNPEGIRKAEQLRNQFVQLPAVENATVSFEIPDGNVGNSSIIYKAGQDSSQGIAAQILTVDKHYLDTYKIPLATGRNIDNKDSSAVFEMVLNESACRALRLDPQKAVGQRFTVAAYGNMPAEVVGVITDFNFGSLQQKIAPQVYADIKTVPIYRFISLKIKPGNIGDAIQALQSKWSSLLPGTPFEYRFMDEMLAKTYQTELQLRRAAYAATFLAITIVLLGVIGLVAQNVSRRTREIGIRKVLGSSIAGIMTLFLKEFITIIVISCLIACPVGYLIMHNWLSDYAYHVSINAVPFTVSIAVLLTVTIMLIIMQTFRAATANPVKSIRTE
jgi:putative ABC transport system permease protein